MGEFDGKVVIITGGALGIGQATAWEFAKSGARVTVADVNAEAGDATIEEVRRLGGEGLMVRADVSNAAQCREAVRATVEAFGGVDILVNNVGIQPPQSYLNVEDTPEDMWDNIINVNLKSCFLMSKYAIPEIRRRGGGAIINTASVQGLQSQPLVPPYAASKGGILSLTRQMALDYAKDNIRVLAVCPGSVDTPLLRGAASIVDGDEDEIVRQWGASHPIGRMGAGVDIANVILFLASEKASFMTGEYVNVDGGFMAQGAWANNANR